MVETDAHEYDDAVQLLRTRLERPLIEQMEHGEFGDQLLAYLRSRSSPRLPFTPKRMPRIMQLCRSLDPQEYAWERRVVEEACAGRYNAASNPRCDRFVEIDRTTFDFSHFEHWDKEAIHGLNRHRWYPMLAHHYWEQEDRRYFDTLMGEWDFHAAKVPVPDEALLQGIDSFAPGQTMKPPYAELDCSIRLMNWWRAYWTILHAAPMTGERCAVLLARCLRLFDRVAARGVGRHEHNFTSMQMEAIHHWAVALPEAVGMDVWRHASRNTLAASLRRAVREDGTQWEQSISYQVGCIDWYAASYLLGRINDQPWGEGYARTLRRMGEYVDALITPDGKLPLLSDSDRSSDWRSALSLLEHIFPDARYVHEAGPTCATLWLTDGRCEPAAHERPSVSTARVFPQGGVGVLRPPRPQRDTMIVLTNGPTNAGHAHNDNLSIQYEAFSQPVIVDPGRWIYTPGPDRTWVCSSEAHNTVWIEDRPGTLADRGDGQAFEVIHETTDRRVGAIESTSGDGLATMRSSFRGHADDAEARVDRMIVVPAGDDEPPWLVVADRMRAGEEHTWTHSWLLPAEQAVSAREGGYQATLTSGLPLAFALAAETAPTLRDEAMFWCPNYAEKSPARWLRLSARGRCMSRAFLFVPGAGAAHPVAIRFTADGLEITAGKVQRSIAWALDGEPAEAADDDDAYLIHSGN
ncbi:MAG: heparinase II/III family protein [Phycisphaeraceae bacterium]